ncbi:beta-1,6-galactanase, partial [Pseudomonas sp. FW305-E2]
MLPLLRDELDRFGLHSTQISSSDETSYNQAAATYKSFNRQVKRLISQVNMHGYQQFGKRDQLFALLAGKK